MGRARGSAKSWKCRWPVRASGSSSRPIPATSSAGSACSSSSTSGIVSSRRPEFCLVLCGAGLGRGRRRKMTPEQVNLVQQSFAKVAPISEQAAVLFYDRLFEVAPSVQAMFPADMTEQRKKLMGTLAVVVNGLGNLGSVLPAASALAKRHVSYGAKPEHYPVVGGVLLWTLEKGLGEAWTSEVADAWTAAYGTLSGYMISEAYGKAQAAGSTQAAE